jgi:hypothetical protein
MSAPPALQGAQLQHRHHGRVRVKSRSCPPEDWVVSLALHGRIVP